MSTAQDTRMRRLRPERWALWGFVVGAAITLPATFFALLFPIGEDLHPYLVASSVLLAPVSDAMATWPGLINVTIGATTNGLIYAAAAGALGTALAKWRHRWQTPPRPSAPSGPNPRPR